MILAQNELADKAAKSAADSAANNAESHVSLYPRLKHLQGEIQEESGRGHGTDQTTSSMSCCQPFQNWDINLYTIALQNPS